MRLTFTKIRSIGVHIGFAGAVWTDRPHLEILSPVLPMFYHSSDTHMRSLTARYLCAAKKAIHALEEYYQRGIHTPNDRASIVPYLRTYNSLSESTATHSSEYLPTIHNYKYEPVLQEGRLVFAANVATTTSASNLSVGTR